MKNNFPDNIDDWFDEKFSQKMAQIEKEHEPYLTIIATQGNLDMAYPPLILASSAAALGWKVDVFFTFYGLDLLLKKPNFKISPLGNPAMPMKLPYGPDWMRKINLNIPNIVANIPGYENLATKMMEETLSQKGVASITQLRDLCLEADVNFCACQMTVDLFGHDKEDFIPEVTEWLGAASFLPRARKSDVCLYT